MITATSKIVIVGAGAFGLSTALWLAHGGYKDITVFDSCALDKQRYNPADGCDGASADINKVFRTSYGAKRHYQNLALEAQQIWLQWNREIAAASTGDLPPGLLPTDKVIEFCGVYFLSSGIELDTFHRESLEAIAKSDRESRKFQFVKGDTEDEQRLKKLAPKFLKRFHVVDGLNANQTNGFLDIQSGINLADKACVYAQFLCEQAGVKFVLGSPQGRLKSLIVHQEGVEKKVTGIRTADGLEHIGDIVVVACGGWTPSILPEAHRTIETTAGTVLYIDLPENRQDLRERFSPDNFPCWAFRDGEVNEYNTGGNFVGGFPSTPEGRLKFVFRGRKYTNFQDHPKDPNLRISTPRTKYSSNPINTVPVHGVELTKQLISQAFPELAEFAFTDSRLCWYTDSIDNEFAVDFVPGYGDSLFICSGGSGHGFKFLPILGKYVKNKLEHRPDQFTEKWKWRVVHEDKYCNGLEEGEGGPRDLRRNQLATPRDFQISGVGGGASKDEKSAEVQVVHSEVEGAHGRSAVAA